MQPVRSLVFASAALISAAGSTPLDSFAQHHKHAPRDRIDYVTLEAPAAARHYHQKRHANVATVLNTVTSYVYASGSAAAAAADATLAAAVTSAAGWDVQDKAAAASAAPSSFETSYYAGSSASPSSAAAVSSSSSSAAAASAAASSGISGDLKAFVGPTEKFEDGKYSCDSVPTGNGVIALDWVGIDGWASVTNSNGDTKKSCTDGYWCSYACQAGMSKTQWPSDQPSSGESRGGLYCKNGKLYRTNTAADHLCEWGKQSANAVNKLDKVISICRTDYPGSENMVLPTRVDGGATSPLAVVDGETYFKWQGKTTSAQYYVNDAGVDVDKGCVWGTEGSGIGNWAPVNLGAGYNGGVTYLSIIPNPNNKTPPNYSLKIEAADGGSVIGDCKYVDGKYNGEGSDGCTVSVTKGSANFVFYN